MTAYLALGFGAYLLGMFTMRVLLRPRLCPRCNYYLSWRESMRGSNDTPPQNPLGS